VSKDRSGLRWLAPLAALLVFGGVVAVLHHELKQLHLRSVFQHLHAIPRLNILAALAFTAASYALLSSYDWLALQYRRRVIPYGRVLFTSFIAYSFGHTLGFAAFTGAAIRFRLYSTAGVTAVDVATISAFCSLSIGIGLTTLTGSSLLISPEQASSLLHLQPAWSRAVGFLLLSVVAAYGLWGSLSRSLIEIRGTEDRHRADRAQRHRPEPVERSVVVAAAA
jgi:uncharacterized membrane protein YbhN (UPF0104 family)